MEAVTTIKDLYAAFARGDVPGAVATMGDTIEWFEAEGNPYAPDGSPFVGPDEIVQRLFARLATEWEDFAVHPATYHEAGDVVVVEGRYTGRHLQSDRSVDAQFCHVWTHDRDGIARFQQYTDTGQFQHVMGAG